MMETSVLLLIGVNGKFDVVVWCGGLCVRVAAFVRWVEFWESCWFWECVLS